MGIITNLTPKEFDLLYHFVQHPKQVFSREQFLKVYGDINFMVMIGQ